MLSPVRLSVVCNVRVLYSGGSNFRQYFYGVRYLGHPLTSTQNFTDIVPVEPLLHLCVLCFMICVFSERELTFTFAICYCQSVCLSSFDCRLSVCLSVTFVRPTQAVQIFGNISTALGTLATHWHPLNTRGVAKYSDFGPIVGYISQTVQDRR